MVLPMWMPEFFKGIRRPWKVSLPLLWHRQSKWQVHGCRKPLFICIGVSERRKSVGKENFNLKTILCYSELSTESYCKVPRIRNRCSVIFGKLDTQQIYNELIFANMNTLPNPKIIHFKCHVVELISVFLGIVLKKLIRRIWIS